MQTETSCQKLGLSRDLMTAATARPRQRRGGVFLVLGAKRLLIPRGSVRPPEGMPWRESWQRLRHNTTRQGAIMRVVVRPRCHHRAFLVLGAKHLLVPRGSGGLTEGMPWRESWQRPRLYHNTTRRGAIMRVVGRPKCQHGSGMSVFLVLGAARKPLSKRSASPPEGMPWRAGVSTRAVKVWIVVMSTQAKVWVAVSRQAKVWVVAM